MKKLAKIFSLLCCVIIAAPLVACSGERKPVSVDPFVDDYDPNKEYNISFFGWGDVKEQNIYRRVISDFMNEYPNIHVTYDATPSGEYLTALTGKINDLPDVFYLPDTEFLQWVDSGRLLNLQGGVAEEDLAKVWDAAVNEYYYNPSTYTLGKSEGAGLFGLPKDLGPFTLGYNIDLVEEQIEKNHLENDADVTALLSGEPCTWEVFISAMKKLLVNAGENVYGIPYYELEHAVYSNNAEFFDETVTTSKLTETAFVDAVQFIADLAAEKIIPDSGIAGIGSGAYEAFYAKKSLFNFVGPWDFATIWEMENFNVDIIPCPYGPGPDREYGTADDGKSTAFIGSMGYCIANTTVERGTAGASLRLAEYLCMNEQAQRRFYSMGQCVPNLKDMAYNEYIPNSLGALEGRQELPENRALFVDILAGFDDADDKIGGKTRILYYTYYSDWRSGLEDTLNQSGVWTGTATAKDILESYEPTFQNDLDLMNADWKG